MSITGSASLLDDVIPAPRLVQIDDVELAISAAEAWDVVRRADLGALPLARALFALRELPARLAGRKAEDVTLRLDDLRSTPEHPGFQRLAEAPGVEVVFGAIGKVWQLDIPFVHVSDAVGYRRFAGPGFVKVAWSLRVEPRGLGSRVSIEVRVDATDRPSLRRFRVYFAAIGPFSHFIRRAWLSALAREHGTPASQREERAMPGDELLRDAGAQLTQDVTIEATPEAIWPWLVQMGCRRGGFYSYDLLDNGGTRSAREVHPELQELRVGDVIPARPRGAEGFEVLRIEPARGLVLGGLYDVSRGRQLRFAEARPERYWQTTWAFELEPLDGSTTRLHVRGRAASPSAERGHAIWIRLVHRFMESAQLRHLKALVEGTAPRDDWRDRLDGTIGAVEIAIALLTPFLREGRNAWGVDDTLARASWPGDDLVAAPRWSWTHAIEIDAPAESVWPWVAQIGAERAGFYSYQWLENLAGCRVRNAETIHREWALEVGQGIRLHPKMPAIPVVRIEPGRSLIAYAAPTANARQTREGWAEASWLFHVEPLGARRCRVVSRYRCDASRDLRTRLAFGPSLLEPIGYAMDRRMLMGIKERAETLHAHAGSTPASEGRRSDLPPPRLGAP